MSLSVQSGRLKPLALTGKVFINNVVQVALINCTMALCVQALEWIILLTKWTLARELKHYSFRVQWFPSCYCLGPLWRYRDIVRPPNRPPLPCIITYKLITYPFTFYYILWVTLSFLLSSDAAGSPSLWGGDSNTPHVGFALVFFFKRYGCWWIHEPPVGAGRQPVWKTTGLVYVCPKNPSNMCNYY